MLEILVFVIAGVVIARITFEVVHRLLRLDDVALYLQLFEDYPLSSNEDLEV